MGEDKLKSALLADDIVPFTSNPAVDIAKIHTIFQNFQSFSGVQINFHKSEIMSISPSHKHMIGKESAHFGSQPFL